VSLSMTPIWFTRMPGTTPARYLCAASRTPSVVDAPPLRLFLGEASLGIAKKQYAERLATWDAWRTFQKRAQG
jgi:hypothetical protein